MTDWITLLPLPAVGILVALTAACLTVALVPPAMAVARWVGAVDDPLRDGRRVHRAVTPTMGGTAMVVAVVAVAVLWLPLSASTASILAGAALACLLGALDDVVDFGARVKLAGQVAVALVPAVLGGVLIDHLTVPFVGAFNLGPAAYPVTVLWIVALMNVVNFIDGMDGLAAGVCGIAAAAFAVIALALLRGDAGVLAAATAGACLGFLWWNFHPARVFMGDAGALALGLLLSTTAIQGALKSAAAVALVLPLLVMLVPILDTSFVILKRLKYAKPVYAADRTHFHHRFSNIGYSQRRTALTIYAWCLALAGAALALSFVPYGDGSGGIDWWPWGVVTSAIIGGAGLLSLGMVYELEILKLGGLKARRRAAATGPGDVGPAPHPTAPDAAERAPTPAGRP